MDPLHICLLNDSFPPMLDGVANVMKNYADIITRRYGTATVVTPAYPNVNDDYPYEVVRYASVDTTKLVGYRTGYPFDAKVLERLNGVQMDLMHVHCPFISAQLTRVIRETRDVPVVFTYHTKFDVDVRKAVRMKLIQDAALKIIVDNIAACDDVWVVSEGAGKNLRSIGYQGNYLVMPNGVDMPKGRADAAAVDAVRKAYGIDPDVTVYLFVGRMMWYKGLRIILDALRMLKNAGKRFSALMTGMDQPLGNYIGNALEVEEAIDVLAGRADGDLKQVALMLGAHILRNAGAAPTAVTGSTAKRSRRICRVCRCNTSASSSARSTSAKRSARSTPPAICSSSPPPSIRTASSCAKRRRTGLRAY